MGFSFFTLFLLPCSVHDCKRNLPARRLSFVRPGVWLWRLARAGFQVTRRVLRGIVAVAIRGLLSVFRE